MKTKLHSSALALALLALAALNAPFASAFGQGTAFTYQGLLNNGTNPVTGSYDLTFSLYNASLGGTPIGNSLTNYSVGVTNGLFTTLVDFGNVYTGNTNSTWVAIGVRTNGAATFTSLNQLQELTAIPYAVVAENLLGSVPLAQLPAPVALLANPGNNNFFAGANAGNLSVTGNNDVAVGGAALQDVTSGDFNTAVGIDALQYDTYGAYNSGFGAAALQWDTSGSFNTAAGYQALSSQPSYVTGSFNTADGANSLWSLSAGSNNVAIGYGAQYSSSIGNNA